MTCLTQTLAMGEMIANESCGFMEVTLNDVAVAEDRIFVTVNSSFIPTLDEVINDGEIKTYVDNDCKETWTVMCKGIFGTTAIIELCYEKEPEEPPVIPCSDHTNELDCIASGCYWYDGACHGTAEVPDGDVIVIPGQPWFAPVQELALHVEEIGGLPNIVNSRDDETIRIVVIGGEHLVDEGVDIAWTKAGSVQGDLIGMNLQFMRTVIDGVSKAKVEFDWLPGTANIGSGIFHASMRITDQWTEGGSSNELAFDILPSVCTVYIRVEDQDGNVVGGIDVNVGGTHILTPLDGDALLSLKCGIEYSALALGNDEYRCVPSSQCSTVFTATEGLKVVLHITKTAAKGKIGTIAWQACHPFGGCSSDIAYFGSDVTLTITSDNIGDAPGEFKTRVSDRDTDEILAETGYISVDEGATWVDKPTFIMPEVTLLNLRIELLRNI